jgi:rhodanese-related sulfurtransferase
MKLLKTILSFVTFAAIAGAAEVPKISPVEAAKKVSEGTAIMIDVREPSEWAESGVAEPAELLSMSDFNGDQKLWKPFLEKNAGKELILYCRSGNRSGQVAAKLAAQGLKVENSGAFKDWAAAGLPVRKIEPAK